MNAETYQNKKITRAEDSNSKTNGINMGKSNTYQRPLLIVASSLLVLLVLIAVAGKSADQHFKSSAQEIAKGAGALADYQVDTANSALEMDIFGMSANSGNEKWCGFLSDKCSCGGTCLPRCSYNPDCHDIVPGNNCYKCFGGGKCCDTDSYLICPSSSF
mmetsp:Transcript_5208/g.5785  ORF Transcript_5208/g.5785 Transcript_5208/m.5785 type:complete len:160 (+) Transcript_5208:84-563(+)